MPVSSRGNKTPMELLMGQKPKSALKYIAWLGVDATVQAVANPTVVDAQLAQIHDHLPELWAKAVRSQVKRRRRNNKPGIGVPRINVGDLVLVAEAVHGHKLRMRWTGPHEVVASINKFCYLVRPVVPPPQNCKTITAHIVRIRWFSNAALNTEADCRRIEESAVKDFPDNFVSKFVTQSDVKPHRAEGPLVRIRRGRRHVGGHRRAGGISHRHGRGLPPQP